MAPSSEETDTDAWIVAMLGVMGIAAFHAPAFASSLPALVGRPHSYAYLAICLALLVWASSSISLRATSTWLRLSALAAWTGTIACSFYVLWAMQSIAFMHEQGYDLTVWYAVDALDHIWFFLLTCMVWFVSLGLRAAVSLRT